MREGGNFGKFKFPRKVPVLVLSRLLLLFGTYRYALSVLTTGQ
jgi:hypothetical protein